MKKIVIFMFLISSLIFSAYSQNKMDYKNLELPIDQRGTSETLQSIAEQFKAPSVAYRPHVYWFWLGSNFRKEGITKDLEAMKEAGIGGATIFNIASSVQNTHAPIENNPWPEQTFCGEAYWDAVKHTMHEARRLCLTIGLHGTPGYATTGGPWIPEERGMQTLVFSKTKVTAARGKTVEISLERPELPVYKGYNNEGTGFGTKPTSKQATYYRDVAVMAVPDGTDVQPSGIIDISKMMDSTGLLRWQAPEGIWNICRIGHAPTMAHPHPLPDDIIGKSLEVDKMSREDNIFHWQQLLDPLKQHIGEYFGNTFTYIWIDSYESGDQNWTPKFREEFIRLKGYDPLPHIVSRQFNEEKNDNFTRDYKQVISRLFVDNSWKTAYEILHQYGLLLYWEPYHGPFNQFHNEECISIPDLPVNEFWTGGDGRIKNFAKIAAKYDKRIIAAEAFTGSPTVSAYTEDPAFLKRSADGCFASGINLFFMHHWVHQPFDDKYQPGMGMGWWGTHFSRYQTWFEPGKAFFKYLARCQMLLQQGVFVSTDYRINHRSNDNAELFFVINSDKNAIAETFSFPVTDRVPELWDAYSGTIRQTNKWKAKGDSIFVDLTLEAGGSIFVIFPKDKNCAYAQLRQPPVEITGETSEKELTGSWKVTFNPKLDTPFVRNFPALIDFSKHSDPAVKYFAGTANYEKTVRIDAKDIAKNKSVSLDLGELHDIAELEINGNNVGVLWFPPYKTDITHWLKKGDNKIVIRVTNNWANRLIGDEQYPADFEWGANRGESGRAMKAFPDWFIKNQTRPSQDRKAFTIWYYYHKDSPLQPAGLLGPVGLIKQKVK